MNNVVFIVKEVVRFEIEVLEKIIVYRSGVNIIDVNRV